MTQQCTYVNQEGLRCTVKPSAKSTNGRCSRHVTNAVRTHCSFPGCPMWTSSLTGQCSIHPRNESAKKRVAECVDTGATPGAQCNFISRSGAQCVADSTHASGRCAKHIGCPARRKCLMEGCEALTYGKYGLCGAHVKSVKRDIVPRLVNAATVYRMREMYNEHGYLPPQESDSDTSNSSSDESGSSGSSGPSSPAPEPPLPSVVALAAGAASISTIDRLLAMLPTNPNVPIYPTVPPIPLC